MPPLRRILREAPDERSHYVRGFAEQTVPDGPKSWDGWADSIESGIARKKAGHDWRGNLRELKNHVRSAIFTSGRAPESTDRLPETGRDPASAPVSSDRRTPSSRRGRESEPPPEGRILGADALTSGMSLDDWTRYIVTKTYALCGRNQNETARRLKINWRTVARWIDHGLLELWAVRRGG